MFSLKANKTGEIISVYKRRSVPIRGANFDATPGLGLVHVMMGWMLAWKQSKKSG